MLYLFGFWLGYQYLMTKKKSSLKVFISFRLRQSWKAFIIIIFVYFVIISILFKTIENMIKRCKVIKYEILLNLVILDLYLLLKLDVARNATIYKKISFKCVIVPFKRRVEWYCSPPKGTNDGLRRSRSHHWTY